MTPLVTAGTAKCFDEMLQRVNAESRDPWGGIDNSAWPGRMRPLLEPKQTIKPATASSPLVSVCIPSYNNARFIAATVQNVLQQSFGDFEIVITDDHSTDQTVSIIRQFTDRRIRLVQNDTNLGMGGNWNKALALASGKYVKLLCGDDLLYPDCLSRQVQALEDPAHSGVALAICGSDVINSSDKVILRRSPRFQSGRAGGRLLIRKCVRWGTNLIGEPAVGLFRRELLVRAGGFDPSNPYMIDLACWAELLRQGDAFVDHERLAAFRISSTSVSTKVGLSQAGFFRRFVQKHYTDPAWGITTLDSALGALLALQWCITRNLLIKWRA